MATRLRGKLSKFFGTEHDDEPTNFDGLSTRLLEGAGFGLRPAQLRLFWGALAHPKEAAAFIEKCVKKLVELEHEPARAARALGRRGGGGIGGIGGSGGAGGAGSGGSGSGGSGGDGDGGMDAAWFAQCVVGTMHFVNLFFEVHNTGRLRKVLAMYDAFRAEHPMHNSAADRVVNSLRRRHMLVDDGEEGASRRASEADPAQDPLVVSTLVELSTLDPPRAAPGCQGPAAASPPVLALSVPRRGAGGTGGARSKSRRSLVALSELVMGGGGAASADLGGGGGGLLGAALHERLDLCVVAPFSLLRLLETARADDRVVCAELLERTIALLEALPAQMAAAPGAMFGTTQRRALALLRLLGELLLACPTRQRSALLRAQRAVAPFFALPQPLCHAAHAALRVLRRELRAPGACLRAALRAEMPHADGALRDAAAQSQQTPPQEPPQQAGSEAAAAAAVEGGLGDDGPTAAVAGGVLPVFVDGTAEHAWYHCRLLRTREAGHDEGEEGGEAPDSGRRWRQQELARQQSARRQRAARDQQLLMSLETAVELPDWEDSRGMDLGERVAPTAEAMAAAAAAQPASAQPLPLPLGLHRLPVAELASAAAVADLALHASAQRPPTAARRADAAARTVQLAEALSARAASAADSTQSALRLAQAVAVPVMAVKPTVRAAPGAKAGAVSARGIFRHRPQRPPVRFDVLTLADLTASRAALPADAGPGPKKRSSLMGRISGREKRASAREAEVAGAAAAANRGPVAAARRKTRRRSSTQAEALKYAAMASSLPGGGRRDWATTGEQKLLHYEGDLLALAALMGEAAAAAGGGDAFAEAAAAAAGGGGAEVGAAAGQVTLKLAVVGGNTAVHQLVCALVALRAISPALFGLVVPQIYVVPAGCNDLAAYMCSIDGWYLRHLAAPWSAPLPIVPRAAVAQEEEEEEEKKEGGGEGGAEEGGGLAAAVRDAEMVAVVEEGEEGAAAMAAVPPPAPAAAEADGDAVASAKLCDLLQSYARGADVTLPVCLFQCECWARAPPLSEEEGAAAAGGDEGGAAAAAAPDVTIPFAMSVELGLMAEAAGVQRKRAAETLEETLASKSFHSLAAQVPAAALQGSGPFDEELVAVNGATPPVVLSYRAKTSSAEGAEGGLQKEQAPSKRTVLGASAYAAISIRGVPADPSRWVSEPPRCHRGAASAGLRHCVAVADCPSSVFCLSLLPPALVCRTLAAWATLRVPGAGLGSATRARCRLRRQRRSIRRSHGCRCSRTRSSPCRRASLVARWAR